jgi:hypothetical protein
MIRVGKPGVCLLDARHPILLITQVLHCKSVALPFYVSGTCRVSCLHPQLEGTATVKGMQDTLNFSLYLV